MKVLKFGGTSMADAGQYRKIKEIVDSDPNRRVVVVSAPGKRFSNDHKVTDLLYLCHAHTQYGVDCTPIFNMIADRYYDIRRELGLAIDLESEFAALKARLDEKQVSREELVSRGEYFSAKLMATYLGFRFIDSADWVYFNYDGSVNTEKTYQALASMDLSKGAVIPGFYGVMPDNRIQTFSRGGSDITGALAAAALDAEAYENWTDVSGILMADPRIVKEPRTIREMTYSELREMSYVGAQVLHEAAVFPVREKNITLNIRNTNAPKDPGTMIRESWDVDHEPERFITGITGKKNFSVIYMAKRGMSNEVGVLRKMLSIFERHGILIDYTPQGIDNVSLVVQSDAISSKLYAILSEIQQELQPDKLQVVDGIAMVAVVGRRMASQPGSSGKIFTALGKAGVNIRMINQGPDELNIIIGVDNRDFAEAIRVLYNSFVM